MKPAEHKPPEDIEHRPEPALSPWIVKHKRVKGGVVLTGQQPPPTDPKKP